MSPASTTSHDRVPKRLVLVDFDWRDADLLPEILARPGLSVRLVAGDTADAAGMKLAELCELPRTTDLADLTREIFDVAVVSERSPRRTQVEGLLLALGTPCVTPETLLLGSDLTQVHTPAVDAPLALHAIALENALGGADLETLVAHALPDMEDAPPAPPGGRTPAGGSEAHLPSLADFPSLEDRQGLEAALAELAGDTGARTAELRAARLGDVRLVARVGTEDPLLTRLIDLALSENAPQVVSPLTGPQEGRAWGAWPFRTTRTRGVVAAAAIDPGSGWTAWQRTVEELRQSWDRLDRERVTPAFPLLPNGRHGWLDPEGFRTAVSLAIARNERDGLPFAMHRFEFEDRTEVMAPFCERIPSLLRDTERLFRPGSNIVLLLTTCSAEAFGPVRRRVLALWETVWRECGAPAPAPGPVEDRVEIVAPAEAGRFRAAAARWVPR